MILQCCHHKKCKDMTCTYKYGVDHRHDKWLHSKYTSQEKLFCGGADGTSFEMHKVVRYARNKGKNSRKTVR